MAKFNLKQEDLNKTVNKSGHVAFKMEDKEKLATMVLTTMFGEVKYYGDNTKELVELAKSLIGSGQGKYVANLAVFARNEMNLRSVSHALCAILAGELKGKEYVKYAVSGVCRRADDILEILSCYLAMYGKPVANSLKRALAFVMNNFNEYQFGKYKGNGKSVDFKDVLRITHAKAKDEKQNDIFKAILKDTLATPYTWETELSAKGNKKEVWEGLIESGKVGTMALLRNLNNILSAQPSNIEKVYERLTDEESILKSKILPFRFYSAYLTVSQNKNCTSKVLDVLEDAIKISTKNIESFKGKTCIAIDVSGSMKWGELSSRSVMTCSDVANVLAAMANQICEESIVITFDTSTNRVNFSTKNGIIANAKSIPVNGGGTLLALPLVDLISNKTKVDRIILLSDNEVNRGFDFFFSFENYDCEQEFKNSSCQSLLERYKKEINPDVIFHAVDLQGYGTQQFKGKNVNIVSGWNEKIFDFMHLAEQGFGKLVEIIELYNEVANYADTDAEG